MADHPVVFVLQTLLVWSNSLRPDRIICWWACEIMYEKPFGVILWCLFENLHANYWCGMHTTKLSIVFADRSARESSKCKLEWVSCNDAHITVNGYSTLYGSVPAILAQNFPFFVLTGLPSGVPSFEHGCHGGAVLRPIGSSRQRCSGFLEWKQATDRDWKGFFWGFCTLLCLRSTFGWYIILYVATINHLAGLVMAVMFLICLAVRQTLWSSTEWLTGQPGDEESAS